MIKNPLVIIGAGGFAREVYGCIDHSRYQVIMFFSETEQPDKSIYGIPVVNRYEELANFKQSEYVCAIGDPVVRERMCEFIDNLGLIMCAPIIHKMAYVGPNTMIGRGTVICANASVTNDVIINNHVIVNINATIGHDCDIGRYVTISPGANISGGVDIGHGAYIGTGSAIREKLKIGRGSTVGMGAVVTKEVPPSEKWVGNPAAIMGKKKIASLSLLDTVSKENNQ